MANQLSDIQLKEMCYNGIYCVEPLNKDYIV